MAAKKLEVVASKNYDGGHAAQNGEPLANPSQATKSFFRNAGKRCK